MITNIHISRKLEKSIDIPQYENELNIISKLGSWYANILYINRKKCWIISNSQTFYSIIINNITNKDIKNLISIFIENLYNHLKYEGINIELKDIIEIVGNIELKETQNNQSVIAYQNRVIGSLKDWKYRMKDINKIPFEEISKRINNIPIKKFEFNSPITEFRKIISAPNTI